MGVTVRCLGVLEVAVGETTVALSGTRLRTAVVVLALAAGRPVSTNELVAALWGDERPDHPRASLQTIVKRLRAALGWDAIVAEKAGYRLAVEPDDVDAVRFTRLVERDELEDALALWRGVPFLDVGSEWLEEFERPMLVERYLVAVERLADLAAAAASAANWVARLGALATEYPVRESLWARLLLALDQAGRPAEALERYESIRTRLAHELGIEPGVELREVHALLLRRTSPVPAPAGTVPRQLPSDLGNLAGRNEELSSLDDLAGLGIAVVTGMAGIGKTTLAVHWAHRAAERFPDGQLYVNLRGFEPDASPLAPSDALRGFLDAFGVPPQQVPADLDAQTARYRGLIAAKRVLVVLDNARNAEQVRPLLPGTKGCPVVVTSRDRLLGLAVDGARAVVLHPLSDADAMALVTARIGRERVAKEPEAADEIVRICAGLPLALAIVAARAGIRPDVALGDVVVDLRGAHHRLDALSSGDPAADVRAVFSWSYWRLGADAARMFCLLGLHPGPDIGIPAAASLTATSPQRTRTLLGTLVRAQLVLETAPARFGMHDLLGAYARELTADVAAAQLHDVRHRMLDYYLHTALPAARLLNQYRDLPDPGPAQPGVEVERPADYQNAMRWFDTEYRGLLAAVDVAARYGFDRHAWQLAEALVVHQVRRGHWQDWADVQRTAVTSARRAGDPSAEARTSILLARALTRLNRWDEATRLCHDGIDINRRTGNGFGEAEAQRMLAHIADECGDHDESLRRDESALRLYQSVGHARGEARALNGIGWSHAQLGNLDRALAYCTRALECLQADVDDPDALAATWDSVAHIRLRLGHTAAAVASYQQSVDLYAAMGDRYFEGMERSGLGDAHLAAGDPRQAAEAWRNAIAILDELHHPDAGTVRSKLRSLSDTNAET